MNVWPNRTLPGAAEISAATSAGSLVAILVSSGYYLADAVMEDTFRLAGEATDMNPIANTPIFLGLTAEDSPATRKQVAVKSVMMAFGLILVFCLLEKLFFQLFGITLPAFRITGGVLVALIGYHMLHGEQSKVHQPGCSAVFVLVRKATGDKVLAGLKELTGKGKILQTSLTKDKEEELRAVIEGRS